MLHAITDMNWYAFVPSGKSPDKCILVKGKEVRILNLSTHASKRRQERIISLHEICRAILAPDSYLHAHRKGKNQDKAILFYKSNLVVLAKQCRNDDWKIISVWHKNPSMETTCTSRC